MSQRLQVVLEDAELAEVRRAARRQRLTTAARGRQALRTARRAEPRADAQRKPSVVAAAVRHDLPAPDESWTKPLLDAFREEVAKQERSAIKP